MDNIVPLQNTNNIRMADFEHRPALLRGLDQARLARRDADDGRMRLGVGRGHHAPLDRAGVGADLERVFRIAVLERPQLLYHVERLVAEAARGVRFGVDAETGRLGALPAGADAEKHLALRHLVEKVHALDEAQRVIERHRQHAEAHVAVARDQRRDVGRELHRVGVPRSAEVVIGEPHVVAELGEPDRLRHRHVDDAGVVARIVVAREEHVHRHCGELHRTSRPRGVWCGGVRRGLIARSARPGVRVFRPS